MSYLLWVGRANKWKYLGTWYNKADAIAAAKAVRTTEIVTVITGQNRLVYFRRGGNPLKS